MNAKFNLLSLSQKKKNTRKGQELHGRVMGILNKNSEIQLQRHMESTGVHPTLLDVPLILKERLSSFGAMAKALERRFQMWFCKELELLLLFHLEGRPL